MKAWLVEAASNSRLRSLDDRHHVAPVGLLAHLDRVIWNCAPYAQSSFRIATHNRSSFTKVQYCSYTNDFVEYSSIAELMHAEDLVCSELSYSATSIKCDISHQTLVLPQIDCTSFFWVSENRSLWEWVDARRVLSEVGPFACRRRPASIGAGIADPIAVARRVPRIRGSGAPPELYQSGGRAACHAGSGEPPHSGARGRVRRYLVPSPDPPTRAHRGWRALGARCSRGARTDRSGGQRSRQAIGCGAAHRQHAAVLRLALPHPAAATLSRRPSRDRSARVGRWRLGGHDRRRGHRSPNPLRARPVPRTGGHAADTRQRRPGVQPAAARAARASRHCRCPAQHAAAVRFGGWARRQRHGVDELARACWSGGRGP